MKADKIREEFLKFFEKKGHQIVPSSSLMPTDPSVLFTTAGMQQFKPYYLGQLSPWGKNVTSCQKCFRTSDIEEVGDSRHLTFLEMLGNFSFGGYFKKEAINLAYEFLFKELKLPLEKAHFTIFAGDDNVPEDKESFEIWQELGIPKEKIIKAGREDNFWGPTGEEGPCGPTTEIYFNGVEIWNIVFNEYYQDKDKKLTSLEQKGVDTGMGLERLAMSCQEVSTVFETDLFEPLISSISSQDENAKKIIADHIKSAVFLIAEGVLPSNVERGYIVRRLLRRAIRYGKSVDLISLAKKVIGIYENIYPELKAREADIAVIIKKEKEKFAKTLEEGLKQFEKGADAFELYATYGFPVELTVELAKEKGIKIDIEDFNKKFKSHQEVSRAGAESKFGGGGAYSPNLHTATHLLHAALREVLGQGVKQMGSDITAQRLRFDFSYTNKMTAEEINKVSGIVNQKIKDKLEVKKEEMSYNEAVEKGALAFFKEKYPERVNVYSINNFSKEICAGPHVRNTSELGVFKITKEESSGAGVRRIRAILE
jgi:alanyl-tRNA synthetase